MMKKLMTAVILLLVLSLCCTALADNVLRPGDKGAAVTAAQERLKFYGYYNGTIDGEYGESTTAAVRSFQKRNKLTVDGKIGPVTLAVLNSSTAVKAPLTTEDSNSVAAVKNVQTRLAYYGYYNGAIDGKYGKGTTAAVKDFQSRNGLKADGKAGDKTLAKLNSDIAVHAPVSSASTAGANADKIKHIQERLAFYGYYTATVNSKFDTATLEAVKLFQKANSLTVDGKVGPKTLAKLDSATAVSKSAYQAEVDTYLKLGSMNNDVKVLQQHLIDTLYYGGTQTGLFDEGVQKAVKAFQSSTGIKSTGIVDTATRNALYNRTASIFTGGIPQRTLSSGDRGWDVKVLQERLAALKYYGASITGYYGDVTITAINAFQKANNLTQNGQMDTVTRRSLWPTQVEAGQTKYPKLTLESEGEYVTKAQIRLKAAGFYTGALDGKFGRHMRNAVKAFQTKCKLEADGVIGTKTWAELMKVDVSTVVQPSTTTKATILRPNDKGTDVKLLQTKLVSLKYDIKVDGTYGPKTTAAVKDLQKKNSLKVDGKVGPETMGVINKLLGL